MSPTLIQGPLPSRMGSRPSVGRRGSSETAQFNHNILASSPIPSKDGLGRTPPPLPLRGGSPSVLSGREGSTFSRRGEGVSSPPPAELELFAHHCRLFYFSSDASPDCSSAEFISKTLAKLPPAHRAAYTRVQSRLRSQAHLHHLRVRISSFHALMSSTVANGSLSLPARSELTGARGKTERLERLRTFIHTWHASSAGPLEPFFRGLWSVLRVQSRGPPSAGGGGPKRVVWEVDDAVFLESGGPEFMHEAVTIIKGVLGFEDQPLTTPPKLRRITTLPRDQSNRARTFSDPFTDRPRPAVVAAAAQVQRERKPSARGPAPQPPPSRRRPAQPASPLDSPIRDEPGPSSPLLPVTPDPSGSLVGPARPEDRDLLLPSGLTSPRSPLSAESTDDEEFNEDDAAAEEADLNRPRFRLWVFPAHIDDEEAERLMGLFPASVHRGRGGKNMDARFPLTRPGRALKDLELGTGFDTPWQTIAVDDIEVQVPKIEAEDEAGVIRSGTGRIWAGSYDRQPGWPGGGWFRFKRWWRRLFGRA
ncbi:hypothetical protein Q8F55_000853 [Vanrija albida]|uniref:CCZ1/INTU/HSP4 first Longin domain-containing protein n=1 Tax=Vanrija albida TaxID=181172 RepID=A0ABR3QEF9_9TREE